MAQQSKGNTQNTVVEAQNLGLGQLGFRNTYEDGLNDVAPTRHGDFIEVINPNDTTVSIHLTMNENIASEDSDASYTGDLAPGGSICGPFKSIQCTTANKEIIGVLSDSTGVDTLYLAGSNEYVHFGDIEAVEGISEFSLSVWVKFFGQEGDVYEIVSKGGYGVGSWTLMHGTNSNPDRMQFSVGSGGGYMWDANDLARDVWHHILITYKADPSGDIKYNLNGVFQDPTDLELGYSDIPQTAYDVKIGTGSNNTYSPMLISQVALWDTVLTPTQSVGVYNSGIDADLTKSYDDNLVGYWKLNDGKKGTTVKDYASKPYKYRFNGTSSYIDLRDGTTPPTGFPVGNSPRTVSAWITPDTITGNQHTIFSYGNLHGVFQVNQWNAAIHLDLYYISYTSTNCLTVDTETHVAVTYDGTTLKMYANGVAVYDASIASTNTTMGLYYSTIGATHYNGPPRETWFGGFIREVGLWNEALDGDAIEAIYNSGKPLQLDGDSGDYTSTSALAGYWKINDGLNTGLPLAGPRVHDTTLNNHGSYDDYTQWEGGFKDGACVNMVTLHGNENWKRERI